jgi:hypothetical protein
MPTIKNLLFNHDDDVRHTILERWGFDLSGDLPIQSLQNYVSQAIENGMVRELIQTLPEDAKRCLQDLKNQGGKIPWSQFSRKYGDIRVMGAGRRERIHPDREPANSAEILWYDGLIGKAFFNTKPEPIEYAYIPDEIQSLYKTVVRNDLHSIGKELVLPKGTVVQRAHDFILDDICTVLSGLRMGMKFNEIQPMRGPFSSMTIQRMVVSLKLYDRKKGLTLDAVQEHLTKPRAQAYYEVVQNWLQSPIFPDLLLMPNLDFGKNPPLRFAIIRQRLLSLLESIPTNTWWDLATTITDIKTTQPEFLRVAGEMDAWFIKDRQTDATLQGFEHWDEVEGAFIAFFISTILYGMGLCDLALDRKTGSMLGFRWCERRSYLQEEPQQPQEETTGALYTLAQGNLFISPSCSRSLRYQIARFCEWKGMRRGEYLYQITPASLQKASQQELQVSQFIGLLKKHQTQETAPGLLNALQRFEEGKGFAKIETAVLLRIENERVLKMIQQSDLKKYILEEINSTTLRIDWKGKEHFQAKLTELGYLCQIDGEV